MRSTQFVTVPLSRLGILAAFSSARSSIPRLLISLLACCLATPLYGATLYSASLTETGFANLVQNPPPPVSLVFTNLPANPLGDATVTMMLAGDFDNSQFEYADVGIFDGVFAFTFGRFLDGNPDNDLFDHPTDVGVLPPGVNIGSATIPLSMLENLVSDGMMTFRLDFSSGVGESGQPDEFVTITVAYEVVPEPSGLTLAASVIVGLLGYIRHRRRPVLDCLRRISSNTVLVCNSQRPNRQGTARRTGGTRRFLSCNRDQ
jgi:hypothetical protein